MAALANHQVAKLDAAKAQNRRDFPQMAAAIDALRIFNPRVIWCREGGKTMGKVPNDRQSA